MPDNSLYDNLLTATNNLEDITFSKYATVTKLEDKLCSVIEDDTNLEHLNIPVLNELRLELGDKIVLGFVNNNLYNPVILGNLTRGITLTSNDVIEESALANLGLPAGSSQHNINLKVNEKINQGGGGIIAVGSFHINEQGHLIATIPNCADNPYYINNNGHLIYDTSNSYNGGLIT